MRVLLIGGGGFVGSLLTLSLLKRGHEVGVVDLMWFGDNLPEVSNQFHKTRLDARNLTVETLKGWEAVIYLAGLSNDPMADYAPYENYLFNAALPAYLALLSRRAGVHRYLHAGSCSIYGQAAVPVGEHTPCGSVLPYGISKAMAEIGVKQLHETGTFETLNFRMGTIGGWSPRMRFDLIVNAMAKSAVTTGKIIVNDPDAIRPILDINDAVKCYVKAVEEPLPIYDRTLNLVSENATVMQVAKIVAAKAKEWAKIEPEIEVRNVTDVRSYAASKNNADAAGFHCDSTIAMTATSAVINIVELKRAGVDLEASQYYNIKRWQELELK